MNKPTQLIFPFQINQKASFESFFCSQDNLNLITRLVEIVPSKHANELIIHGEEGAGKSFLMQAICNELSSSGKQFAFIPMKKALNMGTEIFQNLASLDAVCIDDLQIILANEEWETALFNLINEWIDEGICYGGFLPVWVIPDVKQWPVRECQRIMTNVFYNGPKIPRDIEWCRLQAGEDFDVNLQLLTKGFKNRISAKYMVGCSETNADGGCSTWRTLEVANQAQQDLANL